MYPPTPTPIAAVAPSSIPVAIDYSNWRIWAFADEAIMVWQRMQNHNMGTVIQIAVLLVIFIFFAGYVVSLTRSLTSETEL